MHFFIGKYMCTFSLVNLICAVNLPVAEKSYDIIEI